MMSVRQVEISWREEADGSRKDRPSETVAQLLSYRQIEVHRARQSGRSVSGSPEPSAVKGLKAKASTIPETEGGMKKLHWLDQFGLSPDGLGEIAANLASRLNIATN
jgi:hypothetical protein